MIYHYSNQHLVNIDQNFRNRVLTTNKSFKVSLRKDSYQNKLRLDLELFTQLYQEVLEVHHQFIEVHPEQMIDNTQACLNIREIRNLLTYLQTQRSQQLEFQWVSTETCLKIRSLQQDVIISSFHIRQHNLVKDLVQ